MAEKFGKNHNDSHGDLLMYQGGSEGLYIAKSIVMLLMVSNRNANLYWLKH